MKSVRGTLSSKAVACRGKHALTHVETWSNKAEVTGMKRMRWFMAIADIRWYISFMLLTFTSFIQCFKAELPTHLKQGLHSSMLCFESPFVLTSHRHMLPHYIRSHRCNSTCSDLHLNRGLIQKPSNDSYTYRLSRMTKHPESLLLVDVRHSWPGQH